jgi:hypothetical protein
MTLTNRTQEERQSDQATRKANKRKRLEVINASLDVLLTDQTPGTTLPAWALSHVTKARKGSTPSLIALKRGNYVAWQRNEIRDCTSESCQLFPIRPYKGCVGAEAEETEDGRETDGRFASRGM